VSDVDRYRWQRHRVPGWFAQADLELFARIDRQQRDRDVHGDLLEIGVFQGKSAIYLEYLRRPDEELVLSDLFGEPPADPANRAHSERWYPGLAREDFERQWRRFHTTTPTVIEGDSAGLGTALRGRSFRIIHVDGAHVEPAVRVDLQTAIDVVGPGGVIVVDDYRTAATPGVAAALWPLVDARRLLPVAFTDAKAYLVAAGEDDVAAALREDFSRSRACRSIVLDAGEAVWIEHRPPLLDRVAGVLGRTIGVRSSARGRAGGGR
jgi:predicted O-methyltransferase YrrM